MQPSTNFSLTLKAYWECNGLSKRLFESSAARDGATYMIKGPMGKSLGVKRNGTHLAFAAGTGAITFMDTAAYVARFVMGEMDEEEKANIGEDFKFVYYVTYFNDEQSVGLRLLRLLKELNSKHFDLVVRLSSQKSPRWDEKWIASILPPTCEKLWICGTPVMNDVFENAFHKLAPKYPYLKDLEVV
jgi:ferredoxin-NADP reductase